MHNTKWQLHCQTFSLIVYIRGIQDLSKGVRCQIRQYYIRCHMQKAHSGKLHKDRMLLLNDNFTPTKLIEW